MSEIDNVGEKLAWLWMIGLVVFGIVAIQLAKAIDEARETQS